MLISLEKAATVKEFVQVAQRFSCDITLSSGRYCVDGKSLLGIFSLDLSKPVELYCEDESVYADFSDFGL